MPVSPTYTTALAPAWNEPLLTDSGTANLTGVASSSVSIIFRNMANNVEFTGTGTLTITQASPGIIQYQPSTADTATAGMYHVFCWVTFSNGPQPFDLGVIDIIAK